MVEHCPACVTRGDTCPPIFNQHTRRPIRFQTVHTAAGLASKDLGDDPAVADGVDDVANGDRD